MSDLTVGKIVTNGIQKGLQNFVPLLVNTVLFILTCWIPYLNVGTFIGMVTLPAKMSRGETISMTEIFNPANRKRMGEFFLAYAFVMMGVYVGMIFFLIPGIIISIAWSLTLLLVIDKEKNPIEAIQESNTRTYGKKGTIFLGQLVLNIVIGICASIAALILTFIGKIPFIGPVIMVIGMIGVFGSVLSVMLGGTSYIYGELTKD